MATEANKDFDELFTLMEELPNYKTSYYYTAGDTTLEDGSKIEIKYDLYGDPSHYGNLHVLRGVVTREKNPTTVITLSSKGLLSVRLLDIPIDLGGTAIKTEVSISSGGFEGSDEEAAFRNSAKPLVSWFRQMLESNQYVNFPLSLPFRG